MHTERITQIARELKRKFYRKSGTLTTPTCGNIYNITSCVETKYKTFRQYRHLEMHIYNFEFAAVHQCGVSCRIQRNADFIPRTSYKCAQWNLFTSVRYRGWMAEQCWRANVRSLVVAKVRLFPGLLATGCPSGIQVKWKSFHLLAKRDVEKFIL